MEQKPKMQKLWPGMKPAHIGVLVKSIDNTIPFLSFCVNEKEWVRKETFFSPECMIVGAPFSLKIAVATIQGMTIELLEPEDFPESYMVRYLSQNGEGLHHFAFDFDSQKEHMECADYLLQNGCTIVHHAKINGVEVQYFEGQSGVVVELKSKIPAQECAGK